MSDYHLVSTLHAALVTLSDARKAGDAAAVAAADAQVAAARAAVVAALADGRVASDKHLLDLDFDCLGAILSHLGPGDALRTSHTCTTLRSALFRGGLPGPLAGVCCVPWGSGTDRIRGSSAGALGALDGMQPALGAQRLAFHFSYVEEGDARVLARALDAAPRAARIDITLLRVGEDDIDRLADVLSSPDREFLAPPQVHFASFDSHADSLLRLTRGGVHVVSIEEYVQNERVLAAGVASNTLTQLYLRLNRPFNLPTRFPALRRLILDTSHPRNFTTDAPSLTALAPCLKEIELTHCSYRSVGSTAPSPGFGIETSDFARFVAAIQGVTRVCFGPNLITTLSQNENANLRQMTALNTLRDLEISCAKTWAALGLRSSCPGPLRPPIAEDVITNLPPLAPGVTRLAFSASTRVAFGHPLPALRVLDWRGAWVDFPCASYWDERFPPFLTRDSVERYLHVPLAIPSAAIAPNLHTLMVDFKVRENDYDPLITYGCFDLWTLVAAPTALRVVVIEHARLFCNAPDGFETTTAAFAALLAREAKDLVSVHAHDCAIEGVEFPACGNSFFAEMLARMVKDLEGNGSPVVGGEKRQKTAAENFLCALKERGVRVCRAGVTECLFCMLHDGSDLWPRRQPTTW